MRNYMFYPLDRNGHIVGPAHLITAADDSAAMQSPRQFLNGQDLEGWDDQRLVGLLKCRDFGEDSLGHRKNGAKEKSRDKT